MSTAHYSLALKVSLKRKSANVYCEYCGHLYYSNNNKHNIILDIPSANFVRKYINDYGCIDNSIIQDIKFNQDSEESINLIKENLGQPDDIFESNKEKFSCICTTGWSILSGEIVSSGAKENFLKILEKNSKFVNQTDKVDYRNHEYLKQQKQINSWPLNINYRNNTHIIDTYSLHKKTNLKKTTNQYWKRGNTLIKLNGKKNDQESNLENSKKSQTNTNKYFVATKYRKQLNN